MDGLPLKAIPADHPHRRQFARMERQFGDALAAALDAWRRALFRGVTAGNVHQVLARLQDTDTTNILQDALTKELQAIALEGADKGREQIEREVFGVA